MSGSCHTWNFLMWHMPSLRICLYIISMCQHVSGHVKMFQDVSVRARMCQDVSGRVRMCQDVSGHVSVCPNVSVCPKNMSEWFCIACWERIETGTQSIETKFYIRTPAPHTVRLHLFWHESQCRQIFTSEHLQFVSCIVHASRLSQ